MYHKRTLLDRLMLLIVIIIAAVVVLLSFHNTALLASQLGMNQYLAAGLVEVLFASLLFIRGRQRATQRNVPLFLEIGYFTSFLFVTGVNMYGLSLKNVVVGPIVGAAISGAMWLMESVLVWLWVDSHKPYKKSLREIQREAKREIKEIKIIQRIDWLKYEAQKPDLRLILEARKAEEERKKVVGDGLPEYFLRESEPIKELVAELRETEPKTINVEEYSEETAVVPMRQIGFHMEKRKSAPRFQPNIEARKQAIETAKVLQEELGRLPKKRELMAKGISDHYSREALKALKNG